MLFLFCLQAHIVHLHLTIRNMAKQIGIITVHQVGEVNHLVGLLVTKGVQMAGKHHRNIHFVEFGRQGFLHVIRSVPIFQGWWHVRKHYQGILPHFFLLAQAAQPAGLLFSIVVKVHNAAVFYILIRLVFTRVNKQKINTSYMLQPIILTVVGGKIAIQIIGKLAAEFMITTIKNRGVWVANMLTHVSK